LPQVFCLLNFAYPAILAPDFEFVKSLLQQYYKDFQLIFSDFDAGAHKKTARMLCPGG